MSSPAIKSQPCYTPLQWDLSGSRHLVVAQAAARGRLRELLADAPSARLDVLLVALPAEATVEWETLFPAVEFFASEATLHPALRKILGDARMGLRLYLAGTDGFIWQTARLAREFGLTGSEMQSERCGSLARPVYCTHCTTITPAVKTNPFACPACGRMLFVRDHFSRPLAAYMGIQVDAETPGVIPPVEEVYP